MYVPEKDDEGRTIGVVKLRRRTRCVACYAPPATVACDHHFQPGELHLASQKRCEAPLCDECRVPGQNGADYCPLHREDGSQLELFNVG